MKKTLKKLEEQSREQIENAESTERELKKWKRLLKKSKNINSN